MKNKFCIPTSDSMKVHFPQKFFVNATTAATARRSSEYLKSYDLILLLLSVLSARICSGISIKGTQHFAFFNKLCAASLESVHKAPREMERLLRECINAHRLVKCLLCVLMRIGRNDYDDELSATVVIMEKIRR